MLSMAAISFTLLLLFSVYSEAFVAVPTSSRTTKYKTIQTSNFVFQSNSNNNEEQQQKNEKLRREFLSQILLTTITSSSPLVSTATESPLLSSSTSSKTCLQDLPPVTKGCVRVFLCRHGQTENNRLRLVQGARINPNLNDTGCQQAKRIGYALSGLRNNKPSIGFHSYLERAKETATLASIICLEEEESEKGEKDEKQKQKSVDNTLGKGYISLKPLESIGEVDFGATIEGQKVAEVQNDMAQVYAKWSMGLIDERLEGGESAREVLQRVSQTIQFFSDLANQQQSDNEGIKDSTSAYAPIFAVSHSTFLKVLIAAISPDMSLAESSLLKLNNGCINVLDIEVRSSNKMQEIGPKDKLFGGKLLSMAPRDTSFRFPRVHVVRVNEVRHLEGLL